jgi:hypothetical protein
MILDKINPYVFIVCFCIGIFICYITQPEPKIIIQHPRPDNVHKVVYKDDNHDCYKYESEEVDCPADMRMAIDHPIVINE